MSPVDVSAVGYLVLFTIVGIMFLLGTMVMGYLVRPNAPNQEKVAVYECGEPTIGSSWLQFDLRFYVVALLFVIFDVEVAFFFPWAVVFGKSIQIADSAATPAAVQRTMTDLGFAPGADDEAAIAEAQAAGRTLKRIALGDLLFFFAIVLVGFAYLWKRGDIEWVRALDNRVAEARAGPDPAPESAADPRPVSV